MPPRELVDDEPANVVARVLVLAPWISEASDEQVERRGALAPTEESHDLAFGSTGLAGLGCAGIRLRLGLALGRALRRLFALG